LIIHNIASCLSQNDSLTHYQTPTTNTDGLFHAEGFWIRFRPFDDSLKKLASMVAKQDPN
jgi:hypothetical protein